MVVVSADSGGIPWWLQHGSAHPCVIFWRARLALGAFTTGLVYDIAEFCQQAQKLADNERSAFLFVELLAFTCWLRILFETLVLWNHIRRMCAIQRY